MLASSVGAASGSIKNRHRISERVMTVRCLCIGELGGMRLQWASPINRAEVKGRRVRMSFVFSMADTASIRLEH